MVSARSALMSGIAVLSLALGACPCGSSRRTLVYDGFDGACAEVACGWEIEAGEVASVTTLHPGERGLRLAAGAVIARTVQGLEDSTPRDMIDALVRCEAGGQVRFSVVMLVGQEIEHTIAATTDAPTRDDRHFTRFEMPLTALDGDGNPGGEPLRVRVEQLGTGACVIDEVFFLRGPDFSCNG